MCASTGVDSDATRSWNRTLVVPQGFTSDENTADTITATSRYPINLLVDSCAVDATESGAYRSCCSSQRSDHDTAHRSQGPHICRG